VRRSSGRFEGFPRRINVEPGWIGRPLPRALLARFTMRPQPTLDVGQGYTIRIDSQALGPGYRRVFRSTRVGSAMVPPA
jgi:hypothetical protein